MELHLFRARNTDRNKGGKERKASKSSDKQHGRNPGATQGEPIRCVPAEDTTFLQKWMKGNIEGFSRGRV